MIVPRYRINDSRIAHAGKGLFVDEPVSAGAVITAPDQIKRTYTRAELDRFDENSIEINSSVRWFEDHHTICPEWTDECFINHSFRPTAFWHLGFVFAATDLDPDTEITMDYRYVLGNGYSAGFRDSETGEVITGLPWDQVIRDGIAMLYKITHRSYPQRETVTPAPYRSKKTDSALPSP